MVVGTEARDLQDVLAACSAALNGPAGAGRDLAKENIASDTAARQRHGILQAFQDGRNADWGQVYTSGVTILQSESKDALALWAALAPLPHVRGLGLAGVLVSLQACTQFIKDHWSNMYPALPEGMALRVSVFGQLARRWVSFLKQAKISPADGAVLTELITRLTEFAEVLRANVPAESLPPQLSELSQILNSFLQAVVGDAKPSEGGDGNAPGRGSGDGASAEATGGPGTADDLFEVYSRARADVRGHPEAVLRSFSRVMDGQPSRARKFRARVYMAELYLFAGHPGVAKQMLTFLDGEVGTIKLEDWEPELCGKLWATLYAAMEEEKRSAEASSDTEQKQKELFARICRVDAKQAVGLRPG